MNENNNSFSSYDGYYTNNNFQFTDLTTPLDVNSSNHYFSSITDDFSSPQPLASTSTIPSVPSLSSVHSNNVNLLPFVQIHTTDAQPTNNNFGNIFRRQQNHEEIKSEEPIKSEQNDAAASALQQQNTTNSTPDCQNRTGNVTPITAVAQPARPQSIPQIKPNVQRCTHCPYLSIHVESLEKHVSTVHCTNIAPPEGQRKKIPCPGCENVFYSNESLEVHLLSDHLMCKDEVKQLLPVASEEQPRKSRIYLKNVEFLREPARQEQILSLDEQGYCNTYQSSDGNNLIDLICESGDVLSENLAPSDVKQPTKQKISIKSVDVLREPALMRREEENSFDFLPPADSQSDILCLDDGGISRYPTFLPQPDLADLCPEPPPECQAFDKPRRPKIYIKNVDILKEPIFLPPDNLTNVLNVNDDLHFNLFRVEEDFPSVPGKFMEEGVNSEYSFDCGNNFVDCDNFLLPEDTGFMHADHEPHKSKIYIKNVDILKQPQFQEHPRKSSNFLHLRTVDELNLMNKNEVENLIAPNLEQNIGTPNLVSHSSENSKNSEEISAFRMINQDSNSFNKPTDFQTPPTISWTNDYVLDGLNSIIDSNSGCDQKNRHYELNTPQISIMDDVNNEADNHDPEILFVCAEELINANREHAETGGEMPDIDQSSLEIVEILDDLERDQPSRESEMDPVCFTSSENDVNEFVEGTQMEDGDQMTATPEKGRIYVADNLMETEKDGGGQESNDTVDDNKMKPRPRGRPFGSNRTGITRLRKMYGNSPFVEVGTKCDVNGCAFRFKKPDTSAYHKRCHNLDGSRPMVCPECKSTNFSNWNTLHTHLWRSHKIDMELHSCDLCNFKTPIYSRLVNTHSKIHSEERNYKCDQCEKAFKNSKQLKNHRRWHRTIAIAPPPDVHRCEECGSAFSHLKSLREHFCKGNDLFCCEICGKTLSSKSSLKLHMLTHESVKKFKCNSCDYMANDHNAFRRHRMTHDKSKMYVCPLCDYKSIQSVAYQKHIRIKHPESADAIVHKCKFCPFATINGGLLTVHLAKHKQRDEFVRAEGQKDKSRTVGVEATAVLSLPPDESTNSMVSVSTSIGSTAFVTGTTTALSINELDNKISESSTIETDNQQPRNKIKVKSDLVLTDPAKFSSNAVSPLLLHCFDNAIR